MLEPHPDKKDVEKYLSAWAENDKNRVQDEALSRLFLETYPTNTNLEEIIIKVSALNTLYGTQLTIHLFDIVNNIYRLNVDERLRAGDLSLVNDVVNAPLDSGKKYRCYSFTTKYCSFHRPDVFPIYDSFVDKVLMYLQKRDGFAGDMEMDNRNYESYVSTIFAFQKFYKLEEYSVKDIDRYLWQVGDRMFRKKRK